MSLRAWFLIVAAAVVFRLSFWHTIVLIIGYAIFDGLDQWLAKTAREKVIDDEISGWEQDPDQPEYENKGNLTRLRLTQNEQIIVTRVADIMRRMPGPW